MSVKHGAPVGDPAREAIDSLRGYVYQIYQSALAWTEIKVDEFLYLEVAEDFAIAAANALEAVQVKETVSRVTINSDDVVASIDSFIELQEKNPSLNVSLRHLTTSDIGKEKKPEHRIGETPTLIAWRNLAKAGDLFDLRKVLENSKLSDKSKKHIASLTDNDLREKFLKRIHFDCGAPDSTFLERQIISRISKLLIERGGVHSQAVNCTANILLALLKLSTNKSRNERFVDRVRLEELLESATQITLNRAQFEVQNRLMEKALSTSLSAGTDFSGSQNIKPSPVSEVALPKALASRNEEVGQLLYSLEHFGICWISGAAGMGKTIAARVLAHRNGGVWASINLRGQAGEQAAFNLSEVANAMPNFGLRGLIVDDLDCSQGSSVLDNLHYLLHSANRSDVLLVVTSSNPATSDFLFASGLQEDISITLTEFTEKDIEEILGKLGVKSANWAKYTYLVSGGGHPQLAIAFIQSMAKSGWNPKELQTLDGLLSGSPAVNEVRKRTRERLLRDLPYTTRRLIERLSLKVGGFGRELAIDLGKVAPPIQDTGILLESLTGSWIDQHEGDRFSLSPLLSDYAAKTLTTDDKETIQSAIAESLTKKGRSLDVIDMNSAFLAALNSKNKAVILKLCMAVLSADNDEIEMLAPHLSIFTLFRTDTTAYPSDTAISHMFRGVQLLLLNQVSDPFSRLDDALRCFSEEARNVQNEAGRAMMSLLVYSKLLLQTSKAGLGVNFVGVINELDQLFQNDSFTVPTEALEGLSAFQEEGVTPIGFMFLNQVHQLSKIEDLSTVFNFLDSSSPKLRSRLLAPFDRDDLEVDLLVTGAWLSEHKNNTIDSHVHSAIFARIEKQAMDWNHADLAVCCRKYQAIILDEYGDDKESALAVLNEGAEIYGKTNSELVRAKAKVLYRSEDHEGSLALSKKLIESDAPLNEVEKAFLGRDAAISSEKQGDLKSARRYYLYGSNAAKKTELPDMVAMRVGLLADAALASWHDGDRFTCLKDLVAVLSELNQFAPETLRTAHCHAVTRHVLLWLDQDVTGEARLLENGEETRIYPGCVSNPEPHSEIGKLYITPIEMAWYMLARVENHASLDVGITENLEQFLPNGPVLEGQMLLSSAKIHKSMTRLDAKLFIDALKDTISYFAFARASGERFGGLDIKNVTYGTFPVATEEQQEELINLTEQFVLLYFAMCIIKENLASFEDVLTELSSINGFMLRPDLMELLEKDGSPEDYNKGGAQLIRLHAIGLKDSRTVSPLKVFELAFNVLEMASKTQNYQLFAESLVSWLQKKWQFIWEYQRFLLTHPSLHEDQIKKAINQKDVSAKVKVVDILSAILPMLSISNNNELEEILSTLRDK